MKLENVGIFFDRDGTINTEVDFLRKPEELQLIPQSAQAIHEANKLGVKVFVITNQSGISRGFLTEQDLSVVHKHLSRLLKKRNAHIDAYYYCPHHPEYGKPPYNVACQCRKPGTGMLEKARREFKINLKHSYVVGDRCVDMLAGKNAGCMTFMVLTGYGTTEKDECIATKKADFVVKDAFEAWKQIKGMLNRHTHALETA